MQLNSEKQTRFSQDMINHGVEKIDMKVKSGLPPNPSPQKHQFLEKGHSQPEPKLRHVEQRPQPPTTQVPSYGSIVRNIRGKIRERAVKDTRNAPAPGPQEKLQQAALHKDLLRDRTQESKVRNTNEIQRQAELKPSDQKERMERKKRLFSARDLQAVKLRKTLRMPMYVLPSNLKIKWRFF
jgi:hypothetical protein